jgi:CBS-domain-containing membrane protein
MDTNEFLQKRADEVMTRDVETLRTDDTLAHAASKFLQGQISGAPVVDDEGTCVGVLSLTDILGAADKVTERHAAVADAFFSRADLVLPVSVYEDELLTVRDKIAPAAEKPVGDFMITDIVTVDAGDSLERVIRDLIDAKIHRVIVVDDQRRMLGLITTIDVIAALLRIPKSH